MPHFEKIEYKPIPVSDLLVEMKNLSELMIDLAYSAALFNDKELAEDVIELESRIDTLAYLLDMEIMIAARDAEDAETLIGVSTVASAADKISDAAADIAAIVTRNIGIHPIVGEIFENVEERLMKAGLSVAWDAARSSLQWIHERTALDAVIVGRVPDFVPAAIAGRVPDFVSIGPGIHADDLRPQRGGSLLSMLTPHGAAG